MVYLFWGENSFAMRQKLQALIKTYHEKAGNDFGLERFDAAEIEKPEPVINALTAVPFLATSRLVIITDLTQNKLLREPVVSSLKLVPDTTVVVIYETKPDKRTAAFKQLKKVAQTAEFKMLTSTQLNNWIRQTAAELGAEIDSATARFLAEHAGSDQWRLWHELTKLANYQPQISRETIKKLVKPVSEQSIFELTDTLSSGDSGRAIKLYRKLRDDQEEPRAIIGMLGWHLQNLALAKSSSGSAPELARTASLAPFVAQKALAQSSKMSLVGIKAAFGLLLEADLKLKSTSAQPDQVMEELLYSCSQRLAPQKASQS